MNKAEIDACLLFLAACKGDNKIHVLSPPERSFCVIEEDSFIVPGDSMNFLQSYYLTASYPAAGKHGVIAYNEKRHSLDIFSHHSQIASLQLDQHGSNGVINRLSAMSVVSKDSIWLYDQVAFYLMDSKGNVLNRIKTDKTPICDCNYAMSSSSFGFGKNGELLYIVFADDKRFTLERFDVKSSEVIGRVPIPFPEVNPKGEKNYGYMYVPNVSFYDNVVICNFPYTSEFVVIDKTDYHFEIYKADSHYTKNVIEPYNGATDANEMQIYGWRNPHFYQFLYLREKEIYVRPMLGGIDTAKHCDTNTIVDAQTLYLMFFDKEFNIIGEYPMRSALYNYFNGWTGVEDGIVLFRDNILSRESSEHLAYSVISLRNKR